MLCSDLIRIVPMLQLHRRVAGLDHEAATVAPNQRRVPVAPHGLSFHLRKSSLWT